ncbi:Hypothetical protein CM240_2868 [Clostridium bornimense]|uniref:Uncharacterized protein n=2 Tax=Clostridium bornimense TaxID=1216932 RepID=W6SJU7_9CLOT|nr:Hypothetical protein CM240_2868 [Clostridium bornimense]
MIAIMMAYILAIVSIPIDILAVDQNDTIKVEKYLNYNIGYLKSAIMYKNKSIIQYIEKENADEESYTTNVSLLDNNIEKPITKISKEHWISDFQGKGEKCEFIYSDDINMKKIQFDFDNNSLRADKINNEEKNYNGNLENTLLKVNEKYSTNYTEENIEKYTINKNTKYDNEGNTIDVYTLTIYNEGNAEKYNVVLNEKCNYVSKSNSLDIYFEKDNTIDIVEFMESDSCYYITRIKDDEILTRGIIENCNFYNRDSIAVIGDKVYIKKDSEETCLYEYIFENNKYILNKTFGGYIETFSKDIDDNIWLIERVNDKKYVSKIENDILSRKYEICVDMNRLFVYDEKNIIVASPYGYTSINKNGASVSEIQKENNFPEGTKIIEESNVENIGSGFCKATIESLDPNTANGFNITLEEGMRGIELFIKDIESIKNGVGSLIVEISNNATINIPFSVMNKKLLDGAEGIRFRFYTEDNTEIIKNLKAVNKIFNFNLSIVNSNGEIDIHNFADGSSDIKLTLLENEIESLDKEKAVVFYYNEGSEEFEMMSSRVNGNDVTFNTNHFSKFIIAETVAVPTPDTLEETGSLINIKTISMASLILISIGAFIFLRRRI